MAVASLFRRLPGTQPYICRQCLRKNRGLLRDTRRTIGSAENPSKRETAWAEQGRHIRSGAQQSMLSVLEQRGFVKDIAGGRKALDWLMTEKPIGAYVGVDPTAPSLHVGHLLPLMALYWMHLHGFHTVTLLGNGTVKIGDPSGRTTARTRQSDMIHTMNITSMEEQLRKLWIHVKALGIKHRFPTNFVKSKDLLCNDAWLSNLTAVDLMRGLGSGMRLGTMLSRDSVKLRMETGEGMAVSEFSYPLFQGYDWWHMYSNHGVQMQLGGSDQYGNICAGMDAIGHMRNIASSTPGKSAQEETLNGAYGLTTPLLTTASGEKFGKSAGNAVWLDKDMLNSFDLYQYFLRTADDDVERYLKLFTFIPLNSIHLIMTQQSADASRRIAQHILAKEVVELAHGASAARQAELSHKAAFGHGTNVFSLGALRTALHGQGASEIPHQSSTKEDTGHKQLLAYKREYATTSAPQTPSPPTDNKPSLDAWSHNGDSNIVVLPKPLLQPGSFPHILVAAGLVSSKSEGHRLIRSKGAYVVLPNSGSADNPHGLKWTPIPEDVAKTDPSHFLVDYEALVLRSGKSKIQICHVLTEERFDAEGYSCLGWDEYKTRRNAQDYS